MASSIVFMTLIEFYVHILMFYPYPRPRGLVLNYKISSFLNYDNVKTEIHQPLQYLFYENDLLY